MTSLRLVLAQINTTVGGLAGNVAKVRAGLDQARRVEADIVLFPELCLPGYPPEDLLLKPDFIEANRSCLAEIAGYTRQLTAVVGFVDAGQDIYNAAAVLQDGALAGVYHKALLPNYGVFDEDRYFRRGHGLQLFQLGDTLFGVSICEDIWYPAGPPERQAAAGATLLLNVSASPYHAGKIHERERMLATRAADNVAVVAFCNLVGGQDELLFDGSSLVVDERGRVVARARSFAEDFLVVDLDLGSVFRHRLRDPRRRKESLALTNSLPAPQIVNLKPIDGRSTTKPVVPPQQSKQLEAVAEIYQALVLGTRDYVHKNGFSQAVIGLSGGIDSSLVACIAVDALGPANVIGVSMPSRYSSDHSQSDARQLAENLGLRYESIPIEAAFGAYLETLAPFFAGTGPNEAEENLQSRTRGNILMALSNKFGWLVLTTGNKSEMAVGYATLYGDMAGGFAVIKDVPKTLAYALAKYRNQAIRPDIPQHVLDKPPSAELRPDQLDTDSLPAYDVLDGILKAYVEEDQSFDEILALGFEARVVSRVMDLVDRNEYKRRQAPPGVKITAKAFGKDRRLPITSKYQTARP